MAPEYAVKAPVEVMAEPVSYTKASSYNAATEGFAIYEVLIIDICKCGGDPYNGNTVVVNMGIFMKLFLNFSVLALWPDEANGLEGALSEYRRLKRRAVDSLDTTRMKTGLIDAIWIEHLGE